MIYFTSMPIVNFFSEFIQKHLLSICSDVWVIKSETTVYPQGAIVFLFTPWSSSLPINFYFFRLFPIANNFWLLPGYVIQNILLFCYLLLTDLLSVMMLPSSHSPLTISLP